MSDDFDHKSFALDVIEAINDVADEYDAPKREQLGLLAALGQKARQGEVFTKSDLGDK